MTIVGIGASAGGLKALQAFFDAVPADSGLSYVVILHLDPGRESAIASLLQKRTPIPVSQITEPVELEADHAYIIPPRHDLSMADGTVHLSERPDAAAHAPVDLFFRTLADTHGADAVGIVLSGTGSDGTSGLRRIKEAGGVTIAQAPDEAEYDGMPRSAIATGQVDMVLRAADMPAELLRLDRREPRLAIPESEEEPETGEDTDGPALRQIFGRLRARTGHDFSLYKRTSVLRRLDRRMHFRRVETLPDYVALLRDDPDEVQALFRDLLISVSNFFRDPDAFEAIEGTVVPALFEGKTGGDRVRAWVPGCATGEEVYTLAMLLSEHADTLDDPPQIQIFATDIDEEGCAAAREGIYAATIAADVSAARLERFFTEDTGGYRINKSLREMVLFTTHDLLRDPPFSRLDLISCRNLLIYLGPEAQARTLAVFHYALRPDGFLFLGSAETPGGDGDLFTPVDARRRIYRRGPGSDAHVPRLLEPVRGRGRSEAEDDADRPTPPFTYGALHLRLLEAYAPPSVVVNEQHEILHLSESAGRYLHLAAGEPTRDLIALVPAELRLELRAALHLAFRNGKPVRRSLDFESPDGIRRVDLSVRAPDGAEGKEPFALVVFDESAENDPTDSAAPDGSKTDLPYAELEEELRRARIELQEIVEEREATIEELQASNEELQSVNEEQRATTEELETGKEELQSVNEELSTVNQEHRGTIEELGQTNADLQNLISSTEIGTIFLDRELRVRRFTPTIADTFNLVATDQGRPLAHLTHRLRYGSLIDDARHVLDSLETVEREAQNQDGQRWYALRIFPYRSLDDRIDGVVITLFDITSQKHVEGRLRGAETRLQLALDASNFGDWELDLRTGRATYHSLRHDEIFGYDAPVEEWSWKRFSEHVLSEDREDVDRRFEHALATGEPLEFECRITGEDGVDRWIWARGDILLDDDGKPLRAVGVVSDITARKETERTLRAAKATAEEANRLKDTFLATLSHEFRTPLNAVMGYADLLLLGDWDELRQSQIQRIKMSARHLSSMIDEIVGFARLDAGREYIHLETLDARLVAEEAIEMMEPAARDRHLGLSVDTWPDPIEIETDHGKTRQILINLIGNAIKYTDEGEIVVAARPDADRVVFTVRDTGIGISPDNIEHIFERFWQVDQALTRGHGGTGLGLAAAREYSRLLGGDVEVESRLGDGSTFTFWLPRRPSPLADDHHPHRAGQAAQS